MLLQHHLEALSILSLRMDGVKWVLQALALPAKFLQQSPLQKLLCGGIKIKIDVLSLCNT